MATKKGNTMIEIPLETRRLLKITAVTQNLTMQELILKLLTESTLTQVNSPQAH